MTLLIAVLWVILGLIGAVVGFALLLVMVALIAPLRVRANGCVRPLVPSSGTLAFDALWGSIAVTKAVGTGWAFRLFGWQPGQREKPRTHETKPTEEEAGEEGAGEPAARPAVAEPEPAPVGADKRKRRKRKPRDRRVWRELWGQGLVKAWVRPAARALGELLRVPRCDHVRGTVCVGLGDPADTGVLYGALCAAAGVLGPSANVSVAVEPDFMETRAEAEGEVAASVVPGKIVGVALRLLWRGPTWRTYRAYRVAKRRTKAGRSTGTRTEEPQERSDKDG
jgi:hypothetical protein